MKQHRSGPPSKATTFFNSDRQQIRNLRNHLPFLPNRQTTNIPPDLRQAIENRQILTALHLIHHGADVNTQDSMGNTLLHILLDELFSGLMYAVDTDEAHIPTTTLPPTIRPNTQGNIHLLQVADYLLISKCAMLLPERYHGDTPLHVFSRIPFTALNATALRQLCTNLTKYQTKRTIGMRNQSGVSAWLLSIFYNTPQSVFLAQTPMVDVNESLSEPFHYQTYYPQAFIQKHHDRLLKLWGYDIPMQDYDQGWNGLMLACLFQQHDLLSILLARKDLVLADDHYIISKTPARLREILHGDTPLHYAVLFEDEKLFRFLLKTLDINVLFQRNCQGHTALHKAAQVKYSPILKLLLDHGLLQEALGQTLPEDQYETFVNQSSEQGSAASCYFGWLSHPNPINDNDIRAFIDCTQYAMDRCSTRGEALLHHIVYFGDPNLLRYAHEKCPSANYEIRNGSGISILQLALESDDESAPDMIGVIAHIAKTTHPNLTVNHYKRHYPHLRERLREIEEESLYQHNLDNLNPNHLLDAYIEEKPHKCKASFDITHTQVKLTSTQLSTEACAALTLQAKQCMDYLLSWRYGAHYIHPTPHPELDPSLSHLFELIKKAYDKPLKSDTWDSDDRTFSFSYHGASITLTLLKEKDHREKHPVTLDYDTVVNLMGERWDYLDATPLEGSYTLSCLQEADAETIGDLKEEQAEVTIIPSKARHTNAYIFAFPEAPLLYTLIKDAIDLDSTDKARQLAEDKFKAAMAFPYVEDLSVTHQGMLQTLSQYAKSHTSIHTTLCNKLLQQNKTLECFEAMEMPKIEFPNISVPKANILKKSLDEDARAFIEKFAKRMEQMVYTRRSYQSNGQLHILAAISELLEGNSTCVAVCFDKTFIIASNLKAQGKGISLEQVMADLQKHTGLLFKHLMKLSTDKTISVEASTSLLHSLLINHLPALSEWRPYTNKKVPDGQKRTFLDATEQKHVKTLLPSIIQYMYTGYKDLRHLMIPSEDEEDYHIKTQLVKAITQKYSSLARLTIENTMIMAARFCGRLHYLEGSIITRAMPQNMLDHLSKTSVAMAYTLLPNPEQIHAEMVMLKALLARKALLAIKALLAKTSSTDNIPIGISKLCCPHCTLVLESLRTLPASQFFRVHTQGTHNKYNAWPFPNFLTKPENLPIFSAMLGGKHSALHKDFMEFISKKKGNLGLVRNMIIRLSGLCDTLKHDDSAYPRMTYPMHNPIDHICCPAIALQQRVPTPNSVIESDALLITERPAP